MPSTAGPTASSLELHLQGERRPVPAAVQPFGSALVRLIGVGRKCRKVQRLQRPNFELALFVFLP